MKIGKSVTKTALSLLTATSIFLSGAGLALAKDNKANKVKKVEVQPLKIKYAEISRGLVAKAIQPKIKIKSEKRILEITKSEQYNDDSMAKMELSDLKKIMTNGYVESHFYPFHNEYDPNPGVAFQDRVVARYGLELNAEIRHKIFPKFFLFANPFVLFGNSRPQVSYNYETDPIVAQIKYGAGYKLTDNLDVRLTKSEWKDLGGYQGEKLLWASFSLRYTW